MLGNHQAVHEIKKKEKEKKLPLFRVNDVSFSFLLYLVLCVPYYTLSMSSKQENQLFHHRNIQQLIFLCLILSPNCWRDPLLQVVTESVLSNAGILTTLKNCVRLELFTLKKLVITIINLKIIVIISYYINSLTSMVNAYVLGIYISLISKTFLIVYLSKLIIKTKLWKLLLN